MFRFAQRNTPNLYDATSHWRNINPVIIPLTCGTHRYTVRVKSEPTSRYQRMLKHTNDIKT